MRFFFYIRPFSSVLLGRLFEKKSVCDLFAVHGQSYQRAAVEKYDIPTGRDYTRVTVAVGIEMICRANRASLISFYIFFILFTINDFSKSIMTSNFLYIGDITVTHFIVQYTHNLTLS